MFLFVAHFFYFHLRRNLGVILTLGLHPDDVEWAPKNEGFHLVFHHPRPHGVRGDLRVKASGPTLRGLGAGASVTRKTSSWTWM